MADEDRITLAPMEIHGRSDGVQNIQRFSGRPDPPRYMVILTSILLFIVIPFAFILAVILYPISTPKTEIVAISTRDLLFGGNSSNPYFNATLVIDIAIRNPNMWEFEFGNSSLRFVYGDHGVVGETKIVGGTINDDEDVRISGIVVNIGSFRLSNLKDLDSDLRLGVLELRSDAEIRGTVRSTKLKVSVMRCTMRLDLTDRLIQNLKCNH